MIKDIFRGIVVIWGMCLLASVFIAILVGIAVLVAKYPAVTLLSLITLAGIVLGIQTHFNNA